MQQQKQNVTWRSSWDMFKASVRRGGRTVLYVLLYTLLEIVLLFLLPLANNWMQATFTNTGVLIALRSILVFLVILYHSAWTVIFIRLLDDETMSIKALLSASTWRKVLPVTAFLLLSGVAVFIASLFFVVPGVILALLWFAGVYVLVLEPVTIRQAFYRSRYLTKGYLWPLLGRFSFILFIWGVAGLFFFIPFTGLIITPILTITLTPVFLYFFGQTYQELARIKQLNANRRYAATLGKKILLAVFAVLSFAFFTAVSLVGNVIVSLTSGATSFGAL